MEKLKTHFIAGELENIEFEILNTQAKLNGLQKRLAELKKQHAKEWPTDIDWND